MHLLQGDVDLAIPRRISSSASGPDVEDTAAMIVMLGDMDHLNENTFLLRSNRLKSTLPTWTFPFRLLEKCIWVLL
eukprot:3686745-Amphidinium_carterae.2